jgi:hypothetical protein
MRRAGDIESSELAKQAQWEEEGNDRDRKRATYTYFERRKEF